MKVPASEEGSHYTPGVACRWCGARGTALAWDAYLLGYICEDEETCLWMTTIEI